MGTAADVGEVVRVVAAVAIGFGSGVLAGMFGIGGTVVSTPGIRVLGAPPRFAVGSTVPAILPGALAGSLRYARDGLVRWRVGLVCGAAGALAAVGGAAVVARVEAGWLMVLTAGIMAGSGLQMIRSGRHPRAAAESVSGPDPTPLGERSGPASILVLVGVGLAAGFLAGLLGVGGGVVLVPVFTGVLRLPVKQAVASSLVAVCLFSVTALAAHAVEGNIDWAFAVPLAVGAVPGARLGARFTLAASEGAVRARFGILLVSLAAVFAAAELWSLARG